MCAMANIDTIYLYFPPHNKIMSSNNWTEFVGKLVTIFCLLINENAENGAHFDYSSYFVRYFGWNVSRACLRCGVKPISFPGE